MKLFNWLFNKKGALNLSTAQMVGVAAAVGVAGLAGWQLLSGSSGVNPDTAFSANDADELVYVTGGAPGGYNGVGYAGYEEGGAVSSSIKVKQSRAMELMAQDAMQQPAESATAELDQAEEDLKRYEMDGKSTGLGLKNGPMTEEGVMGGDMSALQKQIAQIQAMADSKSKEAAEAAAAAQKEGTEGAEGAAAAAAQAMANGGKFGRNGGMATAGGSNLQSEALQPGGVPGSQKVDKNAQALAGKTPNQTDTTNLEARYEGGRDAVIEAGKEYTQKADNEIMLAMKRSAEDASSAERRANSIAEKFMGTGRRGGLMMINGERSSLGGGSSSDFDDPGMNIPTNKFDQYAAMFEQFAADKKTVIDALDKAAKNLNKWYNNFWRWSRWIPGVNLITWGVSAIGRAINRSDVKEAVKKFKDTWGNHDIVKKNTSEFLDKTDALKGELMDYNTFFHKRGKDVVLNHYKNAKNKYFPPKVETNN